MISESMNDGTGYSLNVSTIIMGYTILYHLIPERYHYFNFDIILQTQKIFFGGIKTLRLCQSRH